MDICVLNPFFYPYSGGTERVLFEVYRRLAKHHNITVISANFEKPNKSVTEHISGIKVVRLKTTHIGFPGLPMPFPVTLGLREALRRERAQIYHINNRYTYFIDTVNQIKKLDGRMALTLHDSVPRNVDAFTDNGGHIYDIVWGRRMMEYADVITAVSQHTIDATVPKKVKERAYVIYNGVDSNRYKYRSKLNPGVQRAMKELELSEGSVNIMNNGRLVAQKGQIYLIRALAQLLKGKKMDANLFMVGRGYLKDTLTYMALDLGVSHRVRIVNGIAEKMMPYYYNAADTFVSASLYEPASLSVMEALSSRVPVVATRVGGVPEMMKGCGLYARPASVSGLAERIIETIEDHRGARLRSAEGRKLMLKEHNWDNIAKRYGEIFGSVLRN